MLLAIKQSGRVPIIGLNWKDDDDAALEWLAKLGNPYEMVLVDQRRPHRHRLGRVRRAGNVPGECLGHRHLQARRAR